MFSDGSADYVRRTEEIVQEYEQAGRRQREQGRRMGERILVGAVIAVLLKRARGARRSDPRF